MKGLLSMLCDFFLKNLLKENKLFSCLLYRIILRYQAHKIKLNEMDRACSKSPR